MHGNSWDGPDGEALYFCACCDLFAPAEHFKVHGRQQHLYHLTHSMRVFVNLAHRLSLMRGGDPDENLVERGVAREREREYEARVDTRMRHLWETAA